MPRSAPFHVFTPQRDQPEDLEKILVKRHALLASAVEKMRESVLHPDKHRLLFIGPRGMGKSYLVSLIHYRLSKQKALAGKMRFAWLNEDQTSTTFLHLLSRIYRSLSGQYPAEFPSDELEKIHGKEPADAREILGAALLRHLKQRTVVLFLENNLDAILGAMSDVEQRTWRGFIQDYPQFAIVATAQGITADVSSKEKPFFGFFEIHHLDPLTVDEAAELVEKIAVLNDDKPLAEFIVSARGKARMRAIHHLSGGNPRLYLILSDFLTKESLDNLVRLFEETVDRQLTPYFQERMRWISPQQQEIVQFLCQRVHPANVKEIAEGIFSKQNTVSSQLKQLRKKGYLVSKSRGKESLYELAEPLMRLSFQVKEMNNRQPLALIVDFMRVWYDRHDLEERLSCIAPGTWGRDYFEVALHKIDTEGNAFRHSLMLAALGDIDCDNCSTQQLQELRGIAEETDDAEAWLTYGMAIIDVDLQESLRAMSRVIELADPSSFAFALASLGRGTCYLFLGRPTEALEDASAGLEVSDTPWDLRRNLIRIKGKALLRLGKFEEAAAEFTLVIESPGENLETLVRTLVDRGDAHSGIERHDNAITDYGKAIEMDPHGAILAEALSSRSQQLLLSGRNLEALADSERVISIPDAPVGRLVAALIYRGICRVRNGDLAAAMDDYNRVESLPGCPPEWLATARRFRAKIHSLDGDLQTAITDLQSAIGLSGDVAPFVLLDLAQAFLQLKRYDEGLACIARLLDLSEAADLPQEIVSTHLGPILTSVAFGLRGSPEKWVEVTKRVLPLLVGQGLTSGLTAALANQLGELKQDELNADALDRWVSDWESVCSDYSEMQLAIRMLRAGVEWIKTKDESVLLDLVKEERAIVRQALGLEPEIDE